MPRITGASMLWIALLMAPVGVCAAEMCRVSPRVVGMSGERLQRLDHAMQAWERLEVGGVIVGDVPSFRVDHMPYGGVKDSGTGREGVRWAIADMTEERLLVLRSAPG